MQNRMRNSKINWRPEEENALLELHEKQKITSWSAISSKINQLFPGKKRTPKQCRERFINFLKIRTEGSSSLEWAPTQLSTMFQKYFQKGSKWVEISRFLPGKSENAIKNKFYGSVRKLLRRMNSLQKEGSTKNTKTIKEASLMKLLDIDNWTSSKEAQEGEKLEFILKLRNDVLTTLKSGNGEAKEEDLINLIFRIHKFKCLTRFQTVKKLKNKAPSNLKQKIEQRNDKTGDLKVSTGQSQDVEWQEDSPIYEESIFQGSGQGGIQEILNEERLDALALSNFQEEEKDLEMELSKILQIQYQRDRFEFQQWR